MPHTIHRIGACVLGAFLTLHLFNHLLALGSPQLHIAAMEALRTVYRNRMVEVILLACVATQIGTGLTFVRRRWRDRHEGLDVLQLASGAYLMFFLLVHVSAVLLGRIALHLDTNFYYAAAGMHVYPWTWFFVPYYFLAVLALMVHLARAFRWLTQERLRPRTVRTMTVALYAAGTVAAALIVTAFAGGLYHITIPAEYLATYAK